MQHKQSHKPGRKERSNYRFALQGTSDSPRRKQNNRPSDPASTLFDQVLDGGEQPGATHRNDLRSAVRPFRYSCRRFVVSEQASKFVSQLLARLDGLPEFQRSIQEFAFPPFPQSYVEFKVPMAFDDDKDDVIATDMAVLTTAPLWFFFARIPEDHNSGMSSRMMTVAWNAELQSWQGARPWVDMDRTRRENADFSQSMSTMLNTVRLLFLLMARRAVRYVDAPASRKIVRGKIKTYAAKTEVHIDLLDLDDAVTRFAPSRERAAVRHHEVRGHFVHYKTGVSCPLDGHDYQRVANENPDDTRKRWRCKCGALRVWRTCPNGRGDATIGHVSQTYTVGYGERQ